MAQLSDSIEQFIKELMESDAQVELRRNELAHHFGCAPSQINYVIGKTSGLSGIAYWLNDYFHLKGERTVDKRSPLVLSLKEWIDKEYADGRQTSLSTNEIVEMVERLGGV